MINLLPPHVRQEIFRIYIYRVTAAALLWWGVVCVVLTLLLLPPFVLVALQINTLASAEADMSGKVAEYDMSAAKLTEATLLARRLLLSESVSFSAYDAAVVAAAGEGITISGMDYSFSAAGNTLAIVGDAVTRDALVAFRDALENSSYFSEVDLPIHQLTRISNLPFSVSMKIEVAADTDTNPSTP